MSIHFTGDVTALAAFFAESFFFEPFVVVFVPSNVLSARLPVFLCVEESFAFAFPLLTGSRLLRTDEVPGSGTHTHFSAIIYTSKLLLTLHI